MRFPARHGATPIADCFGENPNLKWMMAGGTPMTSEPPAMSLGSFRPRSSQPIELDGIEWYVDICRPCRRCSHLYNFIHLHH